MHRNRAELYVHLVWGTWDRLPLIHPAWEDALYREMISEASSAGGEVVAVGGTADHLHVLLKMQPTASVAGLVKQLKGASSHLVAHRLQPDEFFKWQGGYGAFTVSRWDVSRVARYVKRQAEHHAAGTVRQYLEPSVPPPPVRAGGLGVVQPRLQSSDGEGPVRALKAWSSDWGGSGW